MLIFQDYFDIIKKPIDLSTISKRLEEGFYKTPWEVSALTSLVVPYLLPYAVVWEIFVQR